MPILLTNSAVNEVKNIMSEKGLGSETFLRIAVLGGGCSGLQYSIGFDTDFDSKTDVKYEQNGIAIVTQKKYDLHLEGTEIDFIHTEMARGFSIENPNYPKGTGCAGCGH